MNISPRTIIVASAVLMMLAVMPSSISASEGDIKVVKASGSADLIKGDERVAKREAVQDAKRNAVDQVGSQVIAKTIVENFELVRDRIITKVDGYVHSYDILEESRRADTFMVKIKAEVSSSSIIDDATLIYDEMDKPRLMVIVPEVRGSDVIPTSQAENTISELFLDKGFSLIDQATAKENIKKDELRKIAEGDEKAAIKVGLRAGAEVVVMGSATLGDVESVRGVMYSSKANVSLRALRTDNAGIYAISTRSKAEADGTEDGAQRKALSTTSNAAARDIFWKIVKKWNDEKMMGVDIEVVITGIGFAQLRKTMSGFWDIKGVSDVIQRSFDSPTAIYTISFSGDSMRLAELVDTHRFEGFRMQVLSVSKGKLSLKVK